MPSIVSGKKRHQHTLALYIFLPFRSAINIGGLIFTFPVEELHARHSFSQHHVVAHSIGGLVSRSFINQQLEKKQNLFVKSFITIATPWSGHKAADAGVKHAPVVVPVWIDMAPGSTFLKTLFKIQIPDELPHYLFLSF